MSRSLISFFKNLYESRYIIKGLVRQDLKARYRGSALGMLWAIVMPLGMTLIIAAVYSLLWKNDIHYFVPYLFSGLTPWTFLTVCCDMGALAYIGAEGYIKQIPVHIEIFPVRTTTVAFINNLLFGLVAYFVTLICLSPHMLTPWTLTLIPALALFYLFGLSMGMIAATAQVYIRDYAPLQSLIFQAMFYVTPILYDFNMLSEMGFSVIYRANPFFYLIQVMRDALMGQQPNPVFWGTAAVITAGVFCVAQNLFARTKDKIVFRL